MSKRIYTPVSVMPPEPCQGERQAVKLLTANTGSLSLYNCIICVVCLLIVDGTLCSLGSFSLEISMSACASLQHQSLNQNITFGHLKLPLNSRGLDVFEPA